MLLVGCVTPKVLFPEPVIPVRPNLVFKDCQLIRVSNDRFICLSVEEMRQLFAYVLTTEMELEKCSQTVKEINRK